jgi:hypothetical protein
MQPASFIGKKKNLTDQKREREKNTKVTSESAVLFCTPGEPGVWR